MKIFKVLADSRPIACIFCPIQHHIKPGECGEMVERVDNGWKSGGKEPDSRCKFQVTDKFEY